MQMICFYGLRIGFVVSYDRLRERDAQVFDSHFVVLIRRRDASQMRTQVLERFVVVFGQFVE